MMSFDPMMAAAHQEYMKKQNRRKEMRAAYKADHPFWEGPFGIRVSTEQDYVPSPDHPDYGHISWYLNDEGEFETGAANLITGLYYTKRTLPMTEEQYKATYAQLNEADGLWYFLRSGANSLCAAAQTRCY
jgi:hypothetical protein